MSKRGFGIAVAAVALCGTQGVAEARGKFGVGLRATSQTIASDANMEQSVSLSGGGLHLRYRIGGRVGLEVSTEHVSSATAGGAFTRDANPITLTATLSFSKGLLWDWYFLGGIGATETEVSFRRADGTTSKEVFHESHVHLGLGLERSFGPLALGAELRLVGLTRDNESGSAPQYGEQDGPVAASSTGSQLNLALTYYF